MNPARYLLACAAILVAACAGTPATAPPAPTALPARAEVRLDSLGIAVDASENREVSYTNKRSAYYYTQTHRNDHEEYAGFAGFNVAQKKIFSGYEIAVAGKRLHVAGASVRVYPDRLVRRWPDGVTETLRLVDGEDRLEIELEGASGPVTVRLLGEGVTLLESTPRFSTWSTMEVPGKISVVGVSNNRIFILVIPVEADPEAGLAAAIASSDVFRQSRLERLQGLLNGDRYLWTSDPHRTDALRWLAQTMDQLVTRQRGDGIYAGLPWFNEYWGRDSFIALPGALLVTGQFETARAVLKSFAEFQDLDPASDFYGRVPNIVKADALDYHTVDGTPRFIIALQDYVRYSGDRSIVAELYPNIRASIEGALAHWTDSFGLLTHADNESWMDARRASDLVPYSPRGNRANDVQALWHQQLLAGAGFADQMGDAEAASRWRLAAERVKANFQVALTSPEHDFLADRLASDSTPDFRLRPNQLYALDLLDDRKLAARATRTAWKILVFPWGVASLAPSDPFFHPYHLGWERYHKDEAYHNGTIWLWNNGIAMQRMIELGQLEPAWTLFENMNEQALRRGVVGGLGENMDAYPHPGATWPRLTGTYLQAWSNSEQLRIWYQYFLGIRPDLTRGEVTLAPRLPAGFGSVDFSARIGDGSLRGVYHQADDTTTWDWVVEGVTVQAELDLPGFAIQRVQLATGYRLNTIATKGAPLQVTLVDATGRLIETRSVPPDPNRLASQAGFDTLFREIGFAKPDDPDAHPVMHRLPGASP